MSTAQHIPNCGAKLQIKRQTAKRFAHYFYVNGFKNTKIQKYSYVNFPSYTLDSGLHRLCHQIFATDEAKDRDVVIFVKKTKGTKDLVQSGATGGYIVNHEHILLTND